MAALEAAITLPIFSTTTSKCNSSSPKSLIRLKFLPSISTSTITISPKFPLYSLPLSTIKVRFKLLSTVNEVAIVEEQEQAEEQISQKPNQRRKLFVLNLPWSFSVADIKKLFAESGTATDVEVFSLYVHTNASFLFLYYISILIPR